MSKSSKQRLGAIMAAPVIGVFMVGSAAAAPETCNWKTARDLANAGDYAALCDCAQVTPSFLDRLQSRSDFETTLQVTAAQCPGLASLLTDLPTASLSNAVGLGNAGENRYSDGSDFDRSSDASGGGTETGNNNSGGGGNNAGGGGSGNDNPGDGGDPGDGGSDPGDGDGKGGGKGGDGKGGGKGRDGKGGGKGGDGKGGGKGGDGKGGGKGGDGKGGGKGDGKGGGKGGKR